MAKAKPLGPTFQRELDAVGLGNAPVKFRSDGSFDISGLTPEQRALFLEVRAGHDPTKPVSPALAALPLVTPRLDALEQQLAASSPEAAAQQIAPVAQEIAAHVPRLERAERGAALVEVLGPRVDALEKAVASLSSLGSQLAALTANVSALATIQSRRADELSLFQQHDATALRAELASLKNDIEAHFAALKRVLPNVDAPAGRAW